MGQGSWARWVRKHVNTGGIESMNIRGVELACMNAGLEHGENNNL